MKKAALMSPNSGPVAGPAGSPSPEVGAGEANVGMASVGDGQHATLREKRLSLVQIAMVLHNGLSDLWNELAHQTDRTQEQDEFLGRILCEGEAAEKIIESIAEDLGLRLNRLDTNPAAVRH